MVIVRMRNVDTKRFLDDEVSHGNTRPTEAIDQDVLCHSMEEVIVVTSDDKTEFECLLFDLGKRLPKSLNVGLIHELRILGKIMAIFIRSKCGMFVKVVIVSFHHASMNRCFRILIDGEHSVDVCFRDMDVA